MLTNRTKYYGRVDGELRCYAAVGKPQKPMVRANVAPNVAPIVRCDAIRLHDQPFATGHGSSLLEFALQRQSVPVVMQTSRTLAAANSHYQRLNCSRVLMETRSRAVCVPMGRD